ncbi:MAG: 50S ribosomal protein L15 [Candidatus Oxydemutatoraceae bacterium WSBS_2016_MAG_OTU14]
MENLSLKTLRPAAGSKKGPKRVGRGHGSGSGKTSGRGHKGQKARSGGFHKTGFEGGQMPLQRRLPKFGFRSRKARYSSFIRLNELDKMTETVIDLAALVKAKLVAPRTLRAKVILSGRIKRAVTLQGISVTPGARRAIEEQGGKVGE